MKWLMAIVLTILMLSVINSVQAQPPTVKLTANKTQMMIGDALNIHIEVTTDSDTKFAWPIKADSIGIFEITEMTLPDTTKIENGQLRITQKLTVTAFEAGNAIIPTQVFSYRNNKTGKGGVLRTNMQNITITEPEIDPEADIKDIAPIIELPLTFWEKISPFLAGLLVLSAVALLWFWYRKRKRKKVETIQNLPPPLPPHIVALKRLQELDKAKYWQQGQEKQYYSELTDVLRQYIENRFQIQALELTTDETIAALKKIAIERTSLSQLNQLMKLADMVKFAKAHPSVDQHLQAYSDAESFVRHTKPQEEIVESTVLTT